MGLAFELNRLPSELKQQITNRELSQIIAYKELQLEAVENKAKKKKKLNNEQAAQYLAAFGAKETHG